MSLHVHAFNEGAHRTWLSVLMPAHNAARHLAEALQSVRSQLDEEAEVIVLDDGSTDDTAVILASEAQRQGPRLRVLSHATAQGVAAARNRLLEEARGRWLWFIDADDRMRPGAAPSVRRIVQADPTLELVVVDHAVLRPQPRLKHRLRGEGHRRSLPGPAGLIEGTPALLGGLLQAAQWHLWGKVVRRDTWPASLRFPQGRVFEDLALMPLLARQVQRAWYLDRPCIDYRSNPGSILGSMNPAKLQDWAWVLHQLAAASSSPGAQSPQLARAWSAHLARQALRLAAVAHRLEQDPAWLSPWFRTLEQLDPGLREAMSAWAWQPSRWALCWQARQLGWMGRAPT